MSAQALIQLDQVGKTYATRDGGSVHALGPISFSVGRQEFITIVGPSGCGKSTLLRMIAGLIGHTSGSVLLAGNPVMGPSPSVGMVFQDAVMLPWRTAIENVMVPADVLRLDRKASLARAHSLLALVGLGDFAHKYPGELSGGMQQRVAIARSLLHDPPLLLMDEPFGALDAMTRETMNLEIRRIWREQKKTVVFVTHSIAEAVFLGTRVVVLSSRPGRVAEIVEVGLPDERSLDMMNSDQFGTYTRRIRALFNARGAIE